MLRSLLFFCWAAAIVSAGDPKNVNNTSVPINLADDNVAINSQLPLETTKLSVPPTEKDTHVPSILYKPSTNSNMPVPVTLMAPNKNVLSNDSTTPSIVIPTTSTSNPPTPTTTSTPKPTTTSTPKPTTTSTPKPTTTSIPNPTTTSTSKPTTTSTSKPTTTPIPTTTTPTPLPPPSTGKWKVQENNTLCIIIQMAAQFNVSYTNANNETVHKAVDIPINSNATGKCGKVEQNLTLSWGSQNNSALTVQNNFTLHFVKNDTEKLYSLHHLEISLVTEKSPTDNSSQTVTLIHVAPQFNTGLSNSYRCLKEQSLNLTRMNKNETIGQLKVSHLQFQAFRNDNTTVFGLAKDCSFDTPDIVPITVGCALAGLVVVVLIAYLVGRRRSQSRGYLSM